MRTTKRAAANERSIKSGTRYRDESGKLVNRGANWINKRRRMAIYLRDLFLCAYCDCDLLKLDKQDVTLDHLIPGAGDKPQNLVACCRDCNEDKGNLPYDKYIMRRFNLIPFGVAKKVKIHDRISRPLNFVRAEALLKQKRWPVEV